MSFDIFYLIGGVASSLVMIVVYFFKDDEYIMSVTDLVGCVFVAIVTSWLIFGIVVVAAIVVCIKHIAQKFSDYFFNDGWSFTVMDSNTNQELHQYKAKNWFDMKFQIIKIRVQLFLFKMFN